MPSERAPLTASEDLTTLTGQSITGPVAAWTTGSTEHLAGRNLEGELIEFGWSPASARWRAVNTFEFTGVRMGSAVSAWSAGGVERLAGENSGGELVVWSRAPTIGHWQVLNVSDETGVGIDGQAAAWIAGVSERLAGLNSSGDVIVWSRSLFGGRWRASNVSAQTGQRVDGPLAAWTTQSGASVVDHLAGPNSSGDLLVFWWSPTAARWQVVNASAEAGGARVPGAVVPWVTTSGEFKVEHLGGVSPTGDLVVLWWSPLSGRWQAVNATRIAAGPKVEGRPVSFLPTRGGEALVARTPTDRVVEYWWNRTLDWQARDLTDVTGREMSSDPTIWRQPGTAADRFAGCDQRGHLVVLTDHGEERALTDGLQQPFLVMTPMRHTRRKVISILWDPHKPGIAQPSRDSVEQAVDQMRAYYEENSQGSFTVENVATLGWYDANFPPSEYWPGGGKIGRDSTAEAIRKAAADFDFAAYDTDDDGNLTPDELLVLHILPGSRADGGGLGRTVGDDFTSDKDGIVVDGVRIRQIAEISIGMPPGPGIIAHEFAHPVLGLGDMYWPAGRNPYAARRFSLMDQHGPSGHIDPAQRLKLAWLRPRVALRSGTYVLPNVERTGAVLVLIDPAHGLTEYLIVENRWPGTSFDQDLGTAGLGVWHVVEESASYRRAPLKVSSSDWLDPDGNGMQGPIGWTRQGIRLVRPSQAMPISATRSLFDGSDPATGYDLLSTDTDPSHSQLRWANGAPTGFAIRDISPAGPEMEFRLTVPGRVEGVTPFGDWMPAVAHMLQRSSV